MLGYIKGFCPVLSALRAVQLRHDDLHSGNVMLERPAPGLAAEEWSVRVIDMGSLKPFDAPRKKDKDDHAHFVDHIVAIHNTIRMRRVLQPREQRFLRETARLVRSMLDDDPSIALRSPDQISLQFDYAIHSVKLGTNAILSNTPNTLRVHLCGTHF